VTTNPLADRQESDAQAASVSREAMLADGLNAAELIEREAALNENRAEEAEIFERAAARLRPSWAGASSADSQAEPPPAASAAALPVEVVAAAQLRPSFTPVPFAPVANAPLVAAPTVPFPSVPPSAFSTPVQATYEADTGYQASEDRYDAEFEFSRGSRVSRLKVALLGMARQRTALVAAAAAAACVAVGGLWAAFSGDSGQDAARAAASKPAAHVTKPASAPVPVDVPTSSRAAEGARAHEAPVAAVQKPAPAKSAAKPEAKPLVKKQLAGKAVPARPVAAKAAAKPVTRQLAAKPVAPKALAKPVAAKAAAKKPLLSTKPAAKPSNVTGRLDRSEFEAPAPAARKKPLR
jgi:hypothetical protein